MGPALKPQRAHALLCLTVAFAVSAPPKHAHSTPPLGDSSALTSDTLTSDTLISDTLTSDTLTSDTLTVALLRHEASGLSQGEAQGAQLSWSRPERGLSLSLWGAWSRVELSNQSWSVTHDELRVHPQLNLATRVGSATLAVTSGAGVSSIYERRARHQAARLGLSGERAETSALRWGPELSVGASISLPLSTHVGLQLSALALLRPITLSTEAPALSYAQSLGLSWRFP